jgi:hypothetical protein
VRAPLSASARRAIVDAYAKRKGLLYHWCCFCGTATTAATPATGSAAGISDGVHPKCVEAYKEKYGFGTVRKLRDCPILTVEVVTELGKLCAAQTGGA